MADCPKADRHAELDHIELGDGAWAHLKRRLTHGDAQAVEVAVLAANYETKGASRATAALVESYLSGAPVEWLTENLGPTMAAVRQFLDQYETDHETALLAPEARRHMAQAQIDLYAAYAKAFFVEGSWGDEWPPSDGQVAEVVEHRARRRWNRWNTELYKRLKGDGTDSD